MSCATNSSDINQTFIIEPITIDDIYTTGATLINSTIYFNRTDMLSAYTANLTSVLTGETYTNLSATTATVGGIASGSTFSNRTMSQMWTDLLYPYQTPSFNSFGRSYLPTNNDYDLGQPVLAGNQTFTWGTLNSANVALNSISIDQLYPSNVNVLSGSSNDFTQLVNLTGATISATTQTLNLSIYRITGTNTNSSTFTRTITASWKNRWYYGKNVNTSLTAAQITGLTTTNLVSSVVNTAITFGFGTEFIYVVIPQSMGQPTDWRDSTTGCFGNNIPYSNISATTITNAYGISIPYNIYRSTNQITGAQNVWLCS
jgi:hypothetical protein